MAGDIMQIMNIELTSVQKTLFIPLVGKAIDNRKKSPILADKKAEEIITHINYDFNLIKNNIIGNTIFCLRAKIIDTLLKELLKPNKENVVLHLGCGLDSRYNRIGIKNISWYDIDFKEVIDIRKNYYQEAEYYHQIASSILEKDWLKLIPNGKDNYIVIAEGVFLYIEEEKIKELLQIIKENIGTYYLLFDAINKLSLKSSKNDKSIKETEAKLYFAVDNENEILNWDKGFKFIKKCNFTFKGIKGGNIFIKILFKIVDIIPGLKGFFSVFLYHVE
jgi:O-methyltransferase involved in polyketide biosynthesis